MGRMAANDFLYYGEPMTRYHIALRKSQQWLLYFELLGAVVFLLGLGGVFFFGIFERDLWNILPTRNFWFGPYGQITRYAWLAFVALGFLVYRLTKTERPVKKLFYAKEWTSASATPSALSPDEALTWSMVKKIPFRRRKNIAHFFSLDARFALERAYTIAEKQDSEFLLPAHIFLALLSVPDIRGVFLRLGVSPSTLGAHVSDSIARSPIKRTPTLAPESQQVLFHAHELAIAARQEHVEPKELLVASVEWSNGLQDVLYDSAIDARKLTNVVAWIRVREELRRQYRLFRQAAQHRSKYGMDRAMTAVATPFLNALSQDLTIAAKFGQLNHCVAREKEINEMFRVIEGGRQNVLLVGPPGIGKMSIMEGVVEQMVKDAVPRRLQDKRLVQISNSALLAGTTVAGAEERLMRIVREIRRAGNVILFIHNIHDLMIAGADSGGKGLDVAGALSEALASKDIFVFATTTLEGFNRHIVNSELGSSFVRVDVREMDEDQAIQVIESRIGGIEYKHNVFFSYDAIATAVSFAVRFLHDQYLPESALELVTEAASVARSKRGEHTLVAVNDVAEVIASKTGIPATTVSADESDKLLQLERVMHERIVGQDEAVSLVANALRRARAEIRSTKRPIANFLFLGPTGVGKTELAKTIAEIYFGGEERMLRFDMSEFQDKSSLYRLIGSPGQQGTGLLTEAVRQHPFSLVLLDELEKADKDVINLFLQVFDDGRLTDSVGRVIDFTNTIVIATSNAGTAYVQQAFAQGRAPDEVQQSLIHGELAEYFRPEFLNRFDAIVLFRGLERNEIKQIARLMLKRIEKDLEHRGISLRIEESALDALAEIGFDPTFGARPMRRAIQDKVENALAGFVLSGTLERRDTIVLGAGAEIRIEKYIK